MFVRIFPPDPSKILLTINTLECLSLSLYLLVPSVVHFAYKIKVVGELTKKRITIVHSSEFTWCKFPYKKNKPKYVP